MFSKCPPSERYQYFSAVPGKRREQLVEQEALHGEEGKTPRQPLEPPRPRLDFAAGRIHSAVPPESEPDVGHPGEEAQPEARPVSDSRRERRTGNPDPLSQSSAARPRSRRPPPPSRRRETRSRARAARGCACATGGPSPWPRRALSRARDAGRPRSTRTARRPEGRLSCPAARPATSRPWSR